MHSMLKIVKRLSRAIGTTVARSAVKHIDNKDYDSLVNITVDPSDYSRAESYMLDAQVVAFVKKLSGLPTSVDLKAEAHSSFLKCEEDNRKTNHRLASYINWFERGFVGDQLDLRLFEHLSIVRKRIGEVLGEIPTDLTPRLSGGSTFYDKGDKITIPHKMDSRPSVTEECYTVVADLWRETAWYRASALSPIIVRGNRFTTVPKDSKKDRGICVEPSLNVAYQLAIGAHIREQLRRVTGIDIKGTNGAVNAQTVHRRLAKDASLNGTLATLDLSNASDTISYNLVKLLLPKGWFNLLKALRSPETHFGNNWIKIQKFSSMGNGYTFELETLIFWALSKSVSSGFVSVYGDDIILPTVDSVGLISLLNLCGLTVNKEKSYYDPLHPFRESCGGDFFNGKSVRPIYFKKAPVNPEEWMVLANQIERLKKSLQADDLLIESARQICIGQIPVKYRVFGPPWVENGVLHSDDPTLWRTRKARLPYSFVGRPDLDHSDCGYLELYVLSTRHLKIPLESFNSSVQLASALLRVPSTGPVPRDGISGYRLAWRPTVM